jgi:hypothetical protein
MSPACVGLGFGVPVAVAVGVGVGVVLGEVLVDLLVGRGRPLFTSTQ